MSEWTPEILGACADGYKRAYKDILAGETYLG